MISNHATTDQSTNTTMMMNPHDDCDADPHDGLTRDRDRDAAAAAPRHAPRVGLFALTQRPADTFKVTLLPMRRAACDGYATCVAQPPAPYTRHAMSSSRRVIGRAAEHGGRRGDLVRLGDDGAAGSERVDDDRALRRDRARGREPRRAGARRRALLFLLNFPCCCCSSSSSSSSSFAFASASASASSPSFPRSSSGRLAESPRSWCARPTFPSTWACVRRGAARAGAADREPVAELAEGVRRLAEPEPEPEPEP